jgi:hypothetical protein
MAASNSEMGVSSAAVAAAVSGSDAGDDERRRRGRARWLSVSVKRGSAKVVDAQRPMGAHPPLAAA